MNPFSLDTARFSCYSLEFTYSTFKVALGVIIVVLPQVYPSQCVGSVLHLDAGNIVSGDAASATWIDFSPAANDFQVVNLNTSAGFLDHESGVVTFDSAKMTYAQRTAALNGLTSTSQLTFSMTVKPMDAGTLEDAMWFALGRSLVGASTPDNQLVFQGAYWSIGSAPRCLTLYNLALEALS